MKKPLNKALAHLQRMLMRFQRHQFTIKYKRGPNLYLADTLSRATLPHLITARERDCDVFSMKMESDYDARNPKLT